MILLLYFVFIQIFKESGMNDRRAFI